MLHNLDSIKNEYRLFFVTPAHLFENKVAGGARGLDVDVPIFREALSRLMWDHRFAVVDNKDCEGIYHYYYENANSTASCACNRPTVADDSVPTGWDFVHSCLDTNRNGKRTYIDMRHMDVKARAQLINYIFTKNKFLAANDQIPLIISHAAVTGKPYQLAAFLGLCPVYDNYKEFMPGRIVDFYQKQAGNCQCWMGMEPSEINAWLTNTSGWFHPMSNNLFDEEIAAVYLTNGIIGLTLEERALGWKAYNYIENPSTKDTLCRYFDRWYPAGPEKANRLFKDSILKTEPFVRNLFYIVEKSGRSDISAWEHIAIGSDFDGIMNPIDVCPTAGDIPNFYRFLVRHLQFYAEYLGKTKLLYGPPRQLMDRVFYENGEKFIKRYF